MNNVNDLKSKLMARDGSKCSMCGEFLTNENICINHIIPRAIGGTDSIDNLNLLCLNCKHKYAISAVNMYEFERYIYDIIKKIRNFAMLNWQHLLEKIKNILRILLQKEKMETSGNIY